MSATTKIQASRADISSSYRHRLQLRLPQPVELHRGRAALATIQVQVVYMFTAITDEPPPRALPPPIAPRPSPHLVGGVLEFLLLKKNPEASKHKLLIDQNQVGACYRD